MEKDELHLAFQDLFEYRGMLSISIVGYRVIAISPGCPEQAWQKATYPLRMIWRNHPFK